MDKVIVGLGETLWDMLPDGKKIGGAPANFAYHISQFGLDGYAVSALGNDELGDELSDILNDKQLHHVMPRVDFPTGTVQVKLDNDGIPVYEIKQNVAWDNIPFTDDMKQLALHTRAVCFGSLAQRSPVSRATIARFIDTVPNGESQLKIFDINLRQNFYTTEVIDESLRRCNVLKINDEELEVISKLYAVRGGTQEERCRLLLNRYSLKIVILTCGVKGSYVFTPEETSFIETPQVEVADTVGAGDSFTATFCAALINGKSFTKAHQLAVEVSAFVCTQQGAMPQLPETLRNRMAKSI